MNDRDARESQLNVGLRWVTAHSLWLRDRDDVLARVYTVVGLARGLLAIHAVLVNLLFVLPQATKPSVVVVATVVLAVWHFFISFRLRKPSRRTCPAHLADLGVTLTLIIATALAVPPGGSPLTLAGYWAGGAAAYAILFRSILCGVVFSIATAAALLVVPSHFAMERAGFAFLMILFTVCLGVLIDQFRATIIEQEQERVRSAALAERERLSRLVHDGALQVLALVEREGPSLGPRGIRLAALARESEAQLRAHLQDREVLDMGHRTVVDLAAVLDKYESAKVTVSTMASLVRVPRFLADDVEGALTEILKNVDEHAGPEAKVWILLDQEISDELILWVRDNGVGMSAEQVETAAQSGRMGIRDSIVGRMAALGGSAILKSSPGAGAEWELRFPIDVESMELNDG
ncbi:MAG: hypothetical protein Q4G35_04455 [Propionibacteriaceae bacterium]|nr:hypothetical protein [Propionibacteriaceae bacterium]